MKKLSLFLFYFIGNCLIFGQENKIYEPFQFENYNPIWQHVVIDTSLSGTVKEIDYLTGDSIYYDGFSHFYGVDIFQVKPVFYKDKIFIIEQFGTVLNSEGAFIQCLNRNSGELMWETGYDLRNIEKSEYPSYGYINNHGQLEILGYRQDVSKGPYPFGYWNFAKLTVRKYNIETGYLEEQLLINENDNLTAVLWPTSPSLSLGVKSGIYPYDENEYQYVELVGTLKSLVLDSNSHIIDTIINKTLLHKWDVFVQTKMFRNSQNQTIILNYDIAFGSRNFADSSEFYIMKIDNDNNVLIEKDIKNELKPTDNPEFSYSILYNDDFITFIGDKHVDIGDTTVVIPIYTVFDSDANKIEEIVLTSENGQPYNSVDYFSRIGQVLKLKYEPGILIFANELGSDGNSYLNIFKTDGNGNFTRIKKMKVTGKNHYLDPTGACFTPDGDVVLKTLDFNSDYKNYTNSSIWATVYTLFKAEDLNIKTSTEEPSGNFQMQLYPNPVKDELYLNLEYVIAGKIEIYDVLGRKIMSDLVKNEISKRLNTSCLSQGVYFVKIIVDNQVYSVGKIVKNL